MVPADLANRVVDQSTEALLDGQDVVAFGDGETSEAAHGRIDAACRGTDVHNADPQPNLQNQCIGLMYVPIAGFNGNKMPVASSL